MKLGRMMYNDNVQVPFEDEMNRSGRTHTSPIRNVQIAISEAKFVNLLQISFYYFVDNSETWATLLRMNTYLNQPLRTKVDDNLIIDY